MTAGTNPTTIDDYAITDAIKNGGAVPKISSGSDSPSLPATAVEGELFIATNSKKIYRYTSSAWMEIASAAGSGTLTDVLAGGGLNRSAAGSTVTLALPPIAAVTNATKITTDAFGRVTSGGTLIATDIPPLDYTKITTGKPTTVATSGLTDAMANGGSAKGFSVGTTAPPARTAATLNTFYVNSASGAIYYDDGSAWQSIAAAPGGFTGSLAGDVTGPQGTTVVAKVGSESAANVAAASILANAATNANSNSAIVKRDGSGNFAANDATLHAVVLKDSGSNTATIRAPSTISGPYTLELPAAAATSNGQVLSSTTAGVLSWVNAAIGTLTGIDAGTGISVTGSGATRTVTLANTVVTPGAYGSATSVPTFNVDAQGRLIAAADVPIAGVAPGGAASGDLSGSYPSPVVAKIQNVSVASASPSLGQFLKYTAGSWAPSALGFGDLLNSTSGSAVGSATCTAGKTLYYDTGTKELRCQDISASMISIGTLGVANGGTGANTLTAGSILLGAGTSSISSLAGGSTGNVLYASGASAWSSASPDAAGLVDKASTQTISGAKTFSNVATTNLQLTGGTLGSGRVLTSDPSGNATWQLPAASGLGGSGTTNYIAKFTGTSAAGNSQIVDTGTNVGIGTTNPTAVKFEVVGEIKIGNAGTTCNSTTEGALRYNSTSKKMEYCNGTAWTNMSSGTVANINIGAPSPSVVKNGTASFVVTYGSGADTATISLGVGNITLGGTNFAGCSVTGVSGTGSTRTVSVAGCSGTGTVTISIAANTAQSTTNDPAPAAGPSASFNADNTGPNAPTSVVLGSVPSNLSTSPTISYTAATDVGGSTVASHQVQIIKTSDSSVVYAWATHTSGTAVSGMTLSPNTSYSVLVRAIDALGNVGTTSAASNYTSINQINVVNTSGVRAWSDGTYAASCYAYKNPSGLYTYANDTGDGVYRISSGGSQYDLYCDMTTDGGGWTLVFKSRAANGLAEGDVNAQGSISCLADTSTSCGAKLSDSVINSIAATGSGTSISYRTTNSTMSLKYYFPKSCIYMQTSLGNTWASGGNATNANNCMRYAATYSATPSYIQCTNWGGKGAGLNAWYNCGGSGNYSNVAITVRDSAYTCTSGINNNPSGSLSGSSSTCYANDVLMWVRE